MEGIIGTWENAQAQFGTIVSTVAALLIAWAIIQWSKIWYKSFTGMLEERRMSRRSLQTRKKMEAQVISDGTTILLKELKEQGLLTPAGLEYWEGRLKTIGLVKPEEVNLLGKAWHYPVTHSMRELKKYLKTRISRNNKEVKGRTIICND